MTELLHNKNIDDLALEVPLVPTSPDGEDLLPVTKTSDFVSFLVKEIREADKTGGSQAKVRHKLHFYQIVHGGNVRLARQVLQHLINNDMTEDLSWVLGTHESGHRTGSPQGLVCRLTHWICYSFCVLLFTLLTPVFYSVHAMVHNTYETFSRRISKNIELPFVYAVLSEKKSMVQLFVEFGCSVSTHDKNHNNIYHYLADISADKPNKAIRCHQCLRNSFADIRVLRRALMDQKNYLQLTGFEAIAKFGSLHYLHHILEAHGCIGTRQLEIHDDKVWADTQEGAFDIRLEDNSTEEKSDGDASLCVWEFDLSKYEGGDVFRQQSYLLHLVTGRSVDTLPDADATAIIKSKLLMKWMFSKHKKYSLFCFIAHGICVTISVLFLLYLIIHGGDMHQNPLAKPFLDAYVTLVKDNMDNRNITRTGIVDALANITAVCKPYFTQQEVMANTFTSHDNVTALADRSIMMSMNVLLLSQAVMDLLIRQTFLWYNYNFRASSLTKGVLPVIYRWIPGSYAEKQLAMLMYSLFGFSFYLSALLTKASNVFTSSVNAYIVAVQVESSNQTYTMENLRDMAIGLQEDSESIFYFENVVSILFMICLLLRFLHTIHAMRLLPGIGFFVITTKKMSKHLLQFGLVFLFVMVAFSTMFHFVMRHDECPAAKSEGFASIPSSLFSTYQLALGNSEVEFNNNINAQIAYITCTIIIIVMLLNLIIAVMTTTATDMNAMPWKEAVCRVELWDEILGIEAEVLAMFLPFKVIANKLQQMLLNKKRQLRNGTLPLSREEQSENAKKTFKVIYFNNEAMDE